MKPPSPGRGRGRPGEGRRGYSLLGLLMAVTVVSFLLLPLFLSFQTARRGVSRNLHALTASTLATAQIERLERLTYRRLEAILLGVGDIEAVEQEDIVWPDIVNGPFETQPEQPDIIEQDVHLEGEVSFDRHTYLSYFPEKNPQPNDPDFDEQRRRIMIRVVIRWKVPVRGGRAMSRRFEVRTMVHDEAYNPKPSLRRLIEP